MRELMKQDELLSEAQRLLRDGKHDHLSAAIANARNDLALKADAEQHRDEANRAVEQLNAIRNAELGMQADARAVAQSQIAALAAEKERAEQHRDALLAEKSNTARTCPRCAGTGKVVETYDDYGMADPKDVQCWVCLGSGKVRPA